jgi:4-hydroxybenzoate polyprenyltransferase
MYLYAQIGRMALSGSVKNYLSLVKFSHTLFAMPFALIGFFLGWQTIQQPVSPIDYLVKHNPVETKPLWLLFMLVVLCMVFARSAAMAFNRYIDERFDKLNPRTAAREIPSGKIPKNQALLFVVINCILFMACTAFINTLCFYLSPIALFVILFYSYTKRFTALCHLVLGIGLALAPIGSYLAVVGRFDIIPILFGTVVLTWVSGFDILYALQDDDFDRSMNLKSIPAWLGRRPALQVSIVLHVLSALCILYIGWKGNFGLWYWFGTILFIALLGYQHWLVKPKDISKINMAFATTNGIGSVVFAFFVVLDICL